ncbi:uncharacterized protein LOC112638028 [Camponotus floridanus]|uniref:uncharacterized protein LOC112638028 n=1 Tax=Camponotus floridanus TaxID=104421 RepID=UPI000DC6BF93|nr:uncharacterized protein LOC112638028 [Camponotus floridanus]
MMPMVTVGSSRIQVGDSMKYLGVMIDGLWNFRSHFKYVENKAVKVNRALNRLMPNLRGPGERKRRLYATIFTSVVMYAAPIWSEAFASASDRVTRPLRRLQRTCAIRSVASYRTVSFDAVTLLAGFPLWKFEATLRCRIYNRFIDLKARNVFTHQTDAEVRNGENLLLLRQWDVYLGRPGISGLKTVSALRPFLGRWLNRNFGEVNYYMSQMMTGHGSFGHFLYRIGRRDTAACYHCSSADDSLDHTIAECSAWDIPRFEFRRKMGLGNNDSLTLRVIVEKILQKKEYWNAFSHFAVVVLKVKEEERKREGASSPSFPIRGPP